MNGLLYRTRSKCHLHWKDEGYSSSDSSQKFPTLYSDTKHYIKLKYKIRSLVKQSNHAQIYKAIHRETGQKVIIKRYLTAHFDTKELYFTELAYKVCPEYCLPVMYKNIDSKYLTFIIPEYGMSLYDFMLFRSQVLSLKEARYVFKQVVKCLLKLQHFGLYHLDIKEENILIDPKTFKIKLIDFGCSSELPAFHKNIVGSKEFCAPEIYDGRSDFSNLRKHDVWSLAVTIISSMTGNTPYQNIEDIISGEEDFEIKADVDRTFSRDLKDLLCLMMDLDPERRLSFRRVLKHEFFNMMTIGYV